MPKGTNPSGGNAFRNAVSQAVGQQARHMAATGEFRLQNVHNIEQAIRSLRDTANRRQKTRAIVKARKAKIARGKMLDPKKDEDKIVEIGT